MTLAPGVELPVEPEVEITPDIPLDFPSPPDLEYLLEAESVVSVDLGIPLPPNANYEV